MGLPENGADHKQAVQNVLHALLAAVGVVEGEPDEEA
jgi:hypothetical protein